MDATLLFVIVLPGAALVAVLLWAAKRAERLIEESQRWPSATATIIESKVNRNSKGGRWPTVRYTYTVGAADYRSTRLSFVQETMTAEACERVVARYPVGSTATVWYNPDKPGFAVLERAGKPRSLRIAAYIIGGLFLATLAILIAAPASAGLKSCSVGQRVTSPAGPATVVSTQGSACTVRVDGRPYTDVYAAFMLDPLAGPAPQPDRRTRPDSAPVVVRPSAPGGMPKPGMYQCVGGPAGNLKLHFLGGNGYANEQGKRGTFAPGRNGQIKFVSGPWAGYFAKVLAYGRIGLTSVEGGTFYNMTCDPV